MKHKYWNWAILRNTIKTKIFQQINPFFLPNIKCSIETQPFTIPTLKDICIKHLHVNISIKTNLKKNLRHYNYIWSKQMIQKLVIPQQLKIELLTHNNRCYLHGKYAFYEISCTRTNGFIYIKKKSKLYNTLLQENKFCKNELNKYYTRRKLFGKIRTKYGDQTLNQINQKFGKLLRTDIQFSDKII